MLEIIEHTILDSIKLVPFLFITYLLMEFLEHKTSSKVNDTIKKSGKYGPLLGGILGLLPQCGFSVMATNLYMGRIITLRNTNFNILNDIRRNASNINIRKYAGS